MKHKYKDRYLKEEDVVICKGCKCILKEEDAKKVKTGSYAFMIEGVDYYCNKCAPSYSSVSYFAGATMYKAEVEVDENGHPVSCKKVVPNTIVPKSRKCRICGKPRPTKRSVYCSDDCMLVGRNLRGQSIKGQTNQ